MIHNSCSIFPYRHVAYLFQSSQVVTPLCFKLHFWWWTLPSELTYPSHLQFFSPHVLITSPHFICYILSSEILKTPPHHHSNLLKCLKKNKKIKKRERRKVKRKREIRSYKKENKWEYLLPLSLLHYHLHHLPYPSPSTSLGSIIIISGTFFVFINPLCFISMFSFNKIIPLEIVSFISFSLLTRCIQR